MSTEETDPACRQRSNNRNSSTVLRTKRAMFTNGVALFVCCILLINIIACDKSGVIGLDVQPPSDLINGLFSDTTSLVAYTVQADSLRSDEPLLNLLGSYIDPVFGYSTASFYVKFSMPTSNVNFGGNFNPDSLVMKFGYSGHYGEAPLPQSVMVYRLTENMYRDSAYYSNDDVANDLVDLGGAVIAPADGDDAISIRLNDPVFTPSDSTFGANAEFQSFLKGFYVVTNMMDPGGILYLNPYSSFTKLTLYYNNSLSFDFVIDGESAWFNRFHHNYAGTAVETQLANPSLGDSLVYVQPNEGTMVKIEMPYLSKWVNGRKIAVNKAELTLSVFDDGTQATYAEPENLFILGAGDDKIIPDQYEGASYFGGPYNSADRTYSFNLARYIHELLYDGRSNDGIYLIVPNNLLTSGSVVSANRVILGGPGNTALGMKLNMIYTEL